eukprot:jgi/Ulvmu1/11111/UM070_0027.1
MAFVNISQNIVAEYSGLCEEIAQEFLEQFDVINALLARHGVPATIEPDYIVDWSATDEQRQYVSKFPSENMRSLQQKYAATCKVRNMHSHAGMSPHAAVHDRACEIHPRHRRSFASTASESD